MFVEEVVLDQQRNAKLTAIIQDVGGEYGKIEKRPAIIVMPGGAYWSCSDREAEPVGLAYSRAGYQVFILRYAVGEHRGWPYPLEEYEQAMELISKNEEKWHVMTDRIAVIGFSAGGHLAATAATCSRIRPNAAILGYAALTKEISDLCQPGMPYPVEEVDDMTPPCFLFAARDDNVVDVKNTLLFEQALWEKGIMFESHVYAYGQHGFSTGDEYINTNKVCSRVPHWVDDSIAWLDDVFGKLSAEGMGEPAIGRTVNEDRGQMLSVECTMGHLIKQRGAAETVLKDVFAQLREGIQQIYGPMTDTLYGFISLFKLTDMLKIADVPQESINTLDLALRQIPNQKQK